MHKKFYRVGECFDSSRGRVVTVADTPVIGCPLCAFRKNESIDCATVACVSSDRYDRRPVHFELLSEDV